MYFFKTFITTTIFLLFTGIDGLLSQQQQIYSIEEQKIMERMELADLEEVRIYMREILDADVPEKRALDDRFLKASNYIGASESLGKSYPQFYKKNGKELIDAVKLHPIKYKEMIFDYKLLRKHYDEY